MGQNAAARTLPELDLRPVESSPVSSISTKASLLAMPFKLEALPGSGRQNEQIVQLASKGDFYIDETILPNEDTSARLASLPVTTPPAWKLESSSGFVRIRRARSWPSARNAWRSCRACPLPSITRRARSWSSASWRSPRSILNRVLGSGLSQDYLRRGLSGRRQGPWLPVFLRLRRAAEDSRGRGRRGTRRGYCRAGRWPARLDVKDHLHRHPLSRRLCAAALGRGR